MIEATSFFYISILFAFALERISVNLKFKSDKALSFRSKILYSLAALSYIFIILASFLEGIYFKRHSFFISAIGLFMIIFGITLRNKAIKSLGVNWSFHLEPKSNAVLVMSGPYSYSRHPYYLAVIMELTGLALFFNAFITFWLIPIVQIPVLIVRAKIENELLLSKYQMAFAKYKESVSGLITLRFRACPG